MRSKTQYGLFTILFILLVWGQSVDARANDKVLKIAIVDDLAPYSFIDANGIAQGMLVDYWTLWSAKTGYGVEFFPFALKESVSALSRSQVDIHAGLSRQEQRMNLVEYLPIVYPNKGFLYVKKSATSRTDLSLEETLATRIVGVIEGSSYELYFQDYFPHITLKRFKNTTQLTRAINQNQITAFANESSVSWLLLLQTLQYNTFDKVEIDFPDNGFHAAVAVNNFSLRSIVQEGMEKISEVERVALIEKWIANSTQRQFSNSEMIARAAVITLTVEERAWLQAQPMTYIAVENNWPPFYFIDHNNEGVGYNIDLINTINKNLHINLLPKLYDTWHQGFKALERDEIAGVLSLSWSEERAKTVAYSPVYSYSPHHIIVRQDNNSISTANDLSGAKVSLFENHLLSKILVKQITDLTPVYIITPQQGLDQVQNGVSDSVLSSRPNHQQLSDMGLKISGKVYSKASEYAIGSLKKNRIISSIIAKGVSSITAQQRKQMHDKWLRSSVATPSMFSSQERQYIAKSVPVRVGAMPLKPVISIKNNQISGIVGDMLQEVSKLSGLKFEVVEARDWNELFISFKQQEIDVLPITYKLNEREKYALFGEPYFNLSLSIFVREGDSKLNSLSALRGKRVAMVKHSTYSNIVAAKYPTLSIVDTVDIEHSLSLLLNNEVDAVLGIGVVTEQVIVDGLYQGILRISQTQIKPRALHFMSLKNKPLLHSIVNKSLRAINKQAMARIIDKWIGSPSTKGTVKGALGMGRPPYVIQHQSTKGIEFDLVQRVLGLSNIKIISAKNFSTPQLEKILAQDSSFDFAVTVKKTRDDLYYSDEFITFNNVAISRKNSGFDLNNVADLAGKSIVAFEGAHQYLGEEYAALYNDGLFGENYQELNLQALQVERFITGKADVAILDENIFRFLARQYGYSNVDSFNINSTIFPDNSVRVSFKNNNLRDLFDRNLRVIRQSGEYQKIIDDYVNGMTVEKNEIASLIANVMANEIYAGNVAEIQHLSRLFTSLEHIVKVEIFNNNEILFSSHENTQPYFTHHESTRSISGYTQRVGDVRIYFDDAKLSQKIDEHDFIPPINLFKSWVRYKSIKEIYRRFGYSSRKIEFTPLEKHYIDSRVPITFSNSMWGPLFLVNGDKYQGLVADYLSLISERSGLEFSFQPKSSWPQIIREFNHKSIDLLPSVSFDASDKLTSAKLTKPYASFSFSIVMNEQGRFVNTIEELAEYTFAIPKGYSSSHYLKTNHPTLQFIEVESPEQALRLVRNGKADVFVGHLAVVSRQLDHNFPDLKVVGLLEAQYLHKMMVHADDEILLAILNKSIDAITLEQHQEIENRWMRYQISTAVDYTIIYQIVAVFSVFIFLILAFVRRLSSSKKQLERSIFELKRTQQHLVESEKMAGLGGLVAGVAHEINTPVGIGLTAVSHFVEITSGLQRAYDDNNISKTSLERYLKDATEVSYIINRNLERTAELVKSFKQISVDQSSDEIRTFNVADYVNEILVSVSHITKRSQAKVTLICDPHLRIESCPGALSQILSNLVINSTIHGYPNNEPGHIIITITANKPMITLEYQDDGVGIVADHLSKIFDPFFTTNREHGGSGLGLNIIYNIVTSRLGGTIECISAIGEGTKFNITFNVVNTQKRK